MAKTLTFVSGTHRLFAAYHAPAAAGAHNAAILLCPPLGHEYIQTHLAYRTLATRLAASGFAVLRFDYRGCGNSEGELEQAELQHWIADIGRAIELLGTLSGAEEIGLGGIRLGATLAALVAGFYPAIDLVLLWDPVIVGTDYLGELETRHRRFLHSLRSDAEETKQDGLIERLGFRLGAALTRDVAKIDSAMLSRCLAAKRILLFESGPDAARAPGCADIAECCASVTRLHDGGEIGESWLDEPHRVYLPGKAIGEIASWMASHC